MLKSSKSVVALLVVAVSLSSGLARAAEEKVSRAMEKPLKACNDSYEAKKFDDAIAKCKEAQTLPGRSEYDNFIINQILAVSYAQTKRFADAYPLLKEVVASPHVNPKAKDAFTATLGQIAYQLKDYNGAIEWTQKAIAAGQDTAEARNMIAAAYYGQNKFKECVSATQEVIGRAERSGQRPTENSLRMLYECQGKSNDDSGQGHTIEKLVSYYPKPDYWLNAMITLIKSAHNNERLLLQVYRLQGEVGTLKRSDQYSEMAQLAVEQGYPGEAVNTLQLGLGKGVWTEAREKAKSERLLEAAKKALAQEKDGIAKAEAEAQRTGDGDLLVGVGSSYLFNLGNSEKAAALIQQGIAKGLKKIPLPDAYITLGLAQAKNKNVAEANRTFGKVSKDDNYERLAKLWSLRTK